ncbi:hypothetical protein [Vibrio penaeicida]|uniref:DUF4386 family protein n=1 Tax=Vibrio penaeicida TaxID=104609 RepID=A0AAV5P011_9VIBR|nr:hypothetical protein [Vibrio penaeicida]RTZ24382.1 hypothetical protein EKN09_03835 [Vibrio penaeicida]GLQ75586.1 hypothetical protein GCM10007932_49480 [Vibrio penaeicida]
MSHLQKIGGIAALSEAVIYVSAFVFFGVYWDFPVDADSIRKLAFLSENQTIFSVVNLVMYVLFGILLAVLVLAVHERLKINAPNLSKVASIYGVIWVGLVIASGMISNIGLAAALELSTTNSEQAILVWSIISTIVEGIGGGNEVVGGLWVLLLSIAAYRCNEFSKAFNYLGYFVGIVGILTIYPADVLTAIFGITQIIWFSWLGVVMLFGSKN